MVGSMTGEQVREFREVLKGHLGEIASALEFETNKHPADIDVERLEDLKEALEKVIQGVKIFQDGLYDEKYGMESGDMAISKLKEIQW